jgi:hypothetical protein
MKTKIQLIPLLLLTGSLMGKQSTFIAGRGAHDINHDLLVKSFNLGERNFPKRVWEKYGSGPPPKITKKKIDTVYTKDIVKFLKDNKKTVSVLDIALVHYAGRDSYKEKFSSYRYRSRVSTFNESDSINIIMRATLVDSVYNKLRRESWKN